VNRAPDRALHADVVHKLRGVFRDYLKIESDSGVVAPDTRLREDLKIDSLALVDLVILVEEAFSVEIPSTFNADEVRTVGDVADLVVGLLGAPELGAAGA
jgi:acyl carrier protein